MNAARRRATAPTQANVPAKLAEDERTVPELATSDETTLFSITCMEVLLLEQGIQERARNVTVASSGTALKPTPPIGRTAATPRPKDTPMTAPYTAALAALRDGRFYAVKAERPVKLKTDSGVSLEIPGPRLLASVYAEPWLRARSSAYRSGSALLTRPTGSEAEPLALHQGGLANELLAALQRLPELTTTEAGRPYRDLRHFVTEASPAAQGAYLAAVVDHLRRLLPAYRPSAEKAPRAPSKTAAERLADHRERLRADEDASAREWLAAYLEDATPGERVAAQELYEDAVDVIGEYVEDDEEREDGGTYRVPRQRVFYSVADELLGPRRRTNGSARFYLIPTP